MKNDLCFGVRGVESVSYTHLVDLNFIKISTYMPSVYAASNDLSSFLPCFAVLCGYLILSVFVGFKILKQQDIK